MKRRSFRHDGLTLSYLDSGGDGPVLVALHGHWMEGVTFAPLAARLAPAWRVVALDQRGHGDSDHAPSYTREAYLGDLGALLAHLGIDVVTLLGHSLGGVNAYQFAARHPERVRGLVVEDIGAVVAADVDFVLGWAGTFSTRELLGERVGPRFRPYLEDSFRETPGVYFRHIPLMIEVQSDLAAARGVAITDATAYSTDILDRVGPTYASRLKALVDAELAATEATTQERSPDDAGGPGIEFDLVQLAVGVATIVGGYAGFKEVAADLRAVVRRLRRLSQDHVVIDQGAAVVLAVDHVASPGTFASMDLRFVAPLATPTEAGSPGAEQASSWDSTWKASS